MGKTEISQTKKSYFWLFLALFLIKNGLKHMQQARRDHVLKVAADEVLNYRPAAHTGQGYCAQVYCNQRIL